MGPTSSGGQTCRSGWIEEEITFKDEVFHGRNSLGTETQIIWLRDVISVFHESKLELEVVTLQPHQGVVSGLEPIDSPTEVGHRQTNPRLICAGMQGLTIGINPLTRMWTISISTLFSDAAFAFPPTV